MESNSQVMEAVFVALISDGGNVQRGCSMYVRRGLLCPSFVISLTDYIRDGLFVRGGLCVLILHSFTHSFIHSKQIRDLYLDRSDVIRIVTLKNNISNMLYCCCSRRRTPHTIHSPDDVVYE